MSTYKSLFQEAPVSRRIAESEEIEAWALGQNLNQYEAQEIIENDPRLDREIRELVNSRKL